jgi:hypothetical protein
MGGKCVDMRMSGCGVYAVILADTEVQAVEDEKLAKGKKASGKMPVAFCKLC